jgi:hypothetical protein
MKASTAVLTPEEKQTTGVNKDDLARLKERLLVAARQYSGGSTSSLAELRRAAVAYATAERMDTFDKRCERIREILRVGYELGKVAADKIVSEIKAENIRTGSGPYVGGRHDDTIQLDLGRHYWKFDRAGKLVERGVTD